MTTLKRRGGRPVLVSALAVAALFVTAACSGGGSNDGDDKKTVKVGVIVPLSGINAVFGENALKGIKFATDRINSDGGIEALDGAKIKLIVEDSTSEPNNATTAAEKVIAQNEVSAVLGAFVSSLTLAISEVTERHGIPMITHSWTDGITERGFENIFRIGPKASEAGAAELDMAVEIAKTVGQPMKKIAVMYEDTAYGTANADGLVAHAKDIGLDVVMNGPYPAGITDVSPLLNNLANSDADAVFPMSYLGDAELIVKEMHRRGMADKFPVFGAAAGYIIDSFHENLGKLADGVLSISPGNWDQLPKEISDAYEDKNNVWMVHEAALYGAGLQMIAEAAEETGSTDPQKISKSISKMSYDDGLAKILPGGVIEFDKAGNTKGFEVIMVQWQDGKPYTVFPAEAATRELIWKNKKYDLKK